MVKKEAEEIKEMGLDQKSYLKILSTLPVEMKARSKEWRKFFPHLSGIALSRLLKDGSIACPAVLVRDTVHILSIRRAGELTIKISYDWPDRVHRKAGNHDYPYSAIAWQYAEKNWQTGRFNPDGWREVHRIFLQDPCDLKVLDYNFWIALKWPFSRDFGAMTKDFSAPLYEQYDKNTVHITDNWVLAKELTCGKHRFHYARCARCGSGFCSFPCQGCQTDFKYPLVDHGHIGNCCLEGAMPSKTEAKFKDLGHKFITDPSKIREREEKGWLNDAKKRRRKAEQTD